MKIYACYRTDTLNHREAFHFRRCTHSTQKLGIQNLNVEKSHGLDYYFTMHHIYYSENRKPKKNVSNYYNGSGEFIIKAV